MYIPLSTVGKKGNNEAISHFFIFNIDIILRNNPDSDVVVCGDFNRFNTKSLETNFNLINVIIEKTRHNATLDLLLINEDLKNKFQIIKCPPISTSDHASIMAIPQTSSTVEIRNTKTIYDLRKTNINAFLQKLSCVNWYPIYNPILSVDEKCNKFYDILNSTILSNIPKKQVYTTQKTKPWITPLTIHFINSRWAAYRSNNMNLYIYYRDKVI